MFDETLHGNEEAIEHGSDMIFEVLMDNTSAKTGKTKSSELVKRSIDAVSWRLHGQGHDWQTIRASQKLAAEMTNECVTMQRDIALREQII